MPSKLRRPAGAIKALTDVGPALAKLEAEKKAAGSDAAAAKAKDDEMGKLARAASARLQAPCVGEADGRARKLAADLPWANPRNAGAAAGKSAEQQNVARDIRFALSGIRRRRRERRHGARHGPVADLRPPGAGRSARPSTRWWRGPIA